MIFIRSLGRLAQTSKSLAAIHTSANKLSSANLGNIDANKNSNSKHVISSSIDQSQKQITIKDSCLNRLKQIISEPGDEYLRIQVETGGCSGFSYVFDVESKTKINHDEDLIFERDQYRVVVSKDILPYIKGSSIEFTESLIKSSFQVINPIAETKCSCGASFSVDLGKLAKSKQ